VDTPNSAADLLTIVATGNGQDALDAIQAMTAKHGKFLTELMMRAVLGDLRNESEYPPSGCFWCDRGQRVHARQYVGGPGGWHEWTPPTDRQIKDRMRVRRANRVRKAGA
jgi:hypothetical protein